MTRRASRAGPAAQRGWIGLLVILLALVIVAWLANDALKAYGLSGAAATGGGTAPATTPRADRAAAPATDPDRGAGTPPAATPIERARGLESTLQRQADETARRVDDAAR